MTVIPVFRSFYSQQPDELLERGSEHAAQKRRTANVNGLVKQTRASAADLRSTHARGLRSSVDSASHSVEC